MNFKLSSLMHGFCYRNDEFKHVYVLCVYAVDCGDLDSFVCCEDYDLNEHWFHESVNIHEDDLKNYLDNLIRNAWYYFKLDLVKEL